MTEGYTPTTDAVRNLYAVGRDEVDGQIRALASFDEFDRWLAEHDRQVAERAWDEGHRAGAAWENRMQMRDWWDEEILNPYREQNSEGNGA